MHDPSVAPNPSAWLALDEISRGDQMREWHAAHPNPALHGAIPNPDLHASVHAVIETQIAENDPPVVAQTVDRLTAEGVNRHAVVHAIMDALVMQMHASMTSGAEFDVAAYAMALSRMEGADIVARGLRRAQAVLAADEGDGPGRGPNRAKRREAKKRR